MSLSPHHRGTYWSRIRRWIEQNFLIIIVSAVKICEQCLQIASASWGPPDHDFAPWTLGLWALVPQIKIAGAADDSNYSVNDFLLTFDGYLAFMHAIQQSAYSSRITWSNTSIRCLKLSPFLTPIVLLIWVMHARHMPRHKHGSRSTEQSTRHHSQPLSVISSLNTYLTSINHPITYHALCFRLRCITLINRCRYDESPTHWWRSILCKMQTCSSFVFWCVWVITRINISWISLCARMYWCTAVNMYKSFNQYLLTTEGVGSHSLT